MKINLINLTDDLIEGARLLQEMLGYQISEDGLPVEVKKGDTIQVGMKEQRGRIIYVEPYQFFRALGLFLEHAQKGVEFKIFEEPRFETAGVMIDASRNGVMTVEAIKRFLNYMAVMGYNLLMMYTEDTFEVKGREQFGYMRGRYIYDELYECDQYAMKLGIEMIPCIQTYGHMEQYLKWPEARAIKDTDAVLLAEEEATYEFIEEIICAATAPYRSNRIHIGMDEAWDMGRGNYLTKKGYRKPFDIFCDHLDRIIEITNKHGLKPMMWSDMYFRMASKHHRYYEEDTVFSEEDKAKIPQEVQLVYWHYGEEPGCDAYMIDQHLELEKDIIFAGAVWTHLGHLPDIKYSLESTQASLMECKARNIKEMMMTIWFNDNTETDVFASLLGLQFAAEHCYSDNVSEETLKRRFEFCTGADFNAFMDMGEYHNIFDDGRKYARFEDRFIGKRLLWQDVMEGLFDRFLKGQPMSGHYQKYAEKMREYTKQGGQWEVMYAFCTALFDLLSLKCFIAERLKNAYDMGDRIFLKEAAEIHFPLLLEKTELLHAMHKKQWYSDRKTFGWSALDVRYGGLKERMKTAIERLNSYLDGEISELEELAEKRLAMDIKESPRYSSISSPFKQRW